MHTQSIAAHSLCLVLTAAMLKQARVLWLLALAAAPSFATLLSSPAHAQSTAFTYQG